MKPTQLRARVLAEWRGLPQAFVRPDRAALCGEAIRKVMKDLGLGERLRADEMLGAWREVVGDFLARHSTPRELKAGVLTVAVLQPVVHHQLDRELKQAILDKLQQRFGRRTVRDIRFRLG